MALWIWIVIAAVVVALIVAWLLFRKPLMERREVKRRAMAAELRRHADARTLQADQHDAVAQREAELAQRQREDAEHALERAERVDPDRRTG
jgi:flagellar biosynthesis/type III secretory pathway M-ring protein FliF/YscJ